MLYRIDDGPPTACTGELVDITESQLPILLKLSHPSDRGKLRATCLPDFDRNGADGFTWQWWPWGSPGKTYATHRRYAVFELRLGGEDAHHVLRVRVAPSAVLDTREYSRILHDIDRTLPRALWDLQEDAEGAVEQAVGSTFTHPLEQLEAILSSLAGALAAARRIATHPASEPSPWRPGAKSTPAGGFLTTDLDENRVALSWVRRTHRQLSRLEEVLQRDLEHLQAQLDLARLEGSTPPAWTEPMQVELEQLVVSKGRLKRSARELAQLEHRLAQVCSSAEWRPCPAVLRRSGPATLARAHRPHAQSFGRGVRSVFSRFPIERATILFEVWGALKLADFIGSLGWEGGSPVLDANEVDAGTTLALPRQVRWDFRRDEAQLTLGYGFHAKVVAHPEHDDLLLSRVERYRVSQAGAPIQEGMVSMSETASPDYILVMRWRDKLAWVVGDASFCDPSHVGPSKSVANKLRKMGTYANNLYWMRAGSPPKPPRRHGSFVLVPRASGEYLSAHQDLSDRVLEGAKLLGLRPDDEASAQETRAMLGRVLRTLRWDCENQ